MDKPSPKPQSGPVKLPHMADDFQGGFNEPPPPPWVNESHTQPQNPPSSVGGESPFLQTLKSIQGKSAPLPLPQTPPSQPQAAVPKPPPIPAPVQPAYGVPPTPTTSEAVPQPYQQSQEYDPYGNIPSVTTDGLPIEDGIKTFDDTELKQSMEDLPELPKFDDVEMPIPSEDTSTGPVNHPHASTTPPPPPPPPPPFPQQLHQSQNQQPPPPPPSPTLAKSLRPQKGKPVALIILLFLLFIALGGFLVYSVFFQKKPEINPVPLAEEKPQVELVYWSLWADSQALNEIIAQYENENPNVTIKFVHQSIKDYRQRLQSAINDGTGPDIFRFHNTWKPMLKNDLYPDQNKLIEPYQYFPVVQDDMKINNEVFSVAVGFDTLALYYNPVMLQKAGFTSPPQNWNDLMEMAKKLRVPQDTTKPLQVGGVALGTTNNVEHFSDILGLMLLQNEADPIAPQGEHTFSSLHYYTLFTMREKVWDTTMPASTYAFANSKVAMMFAPSWRSFEIKEMNPTLEFKTAPVPQLPGSQVAWASYWLEGVSRKSKNTDEAWKFLAYLCQDENLAKLYTANANTRLFGEPYPKPSLAVSIQSHPQVGAFVAQGPYAKSSYMAAKTYDGGINDRISKYYEDAVNAILSGTKPEATLPTLSQGVSQVLQQYGLSSTARRPKTASQYPLEPLPASASAETTPGDDSTDDVIF